MSSVGRSVAVGGKTSRLSCRQAHRGSSAARCRLSRLTVLCCEPKAGFRCCLTCKKPHCRRRRWRGVASPSDHSAFSAQLVAALRGWQRSFARASSSSRRTKWPSELREGEERREGPKMADALLSRSASAAAVSSSSFRFHATMPMPSNPSILPADQRCSYFGSFGAVVTSRARTVLDKTADTIERRDEREGTLQCAIRGEREPRLRACSAQSGQAKYFALKINLPSFLPTSKKPAR